MAYFDDKGYTSQYKKEKPEPQMLYFNSMKIQPLLFALLFFHNSTFCQSLESAKRPSVLITEKEIRMKIVLAKLRNFDAVIGQPFGSFSVKGNDGNSLTSDNLKGKVTLVTFWFDACSPCHRQFDHLNSLYTRYQADTSFQILSFSPDNNVELAKNVLKYNLLYRNISIPAALSSKLIGMYHGYPTNYLIDSRGNVSFGHGGI